VAGFDSEKYFFMPYLNGVMNFEQLSHEKPKVIEK